MDASTREQVLELASQFEKGWISRRAFIRMPTALGLSVSAAGIFPDTALAAE